LRHRLQHHQPDALEILLAQAPLELLALVQAERQAQRTLAAPALQLLNAVLQQLHGFHARGQVGALALQLDHLVQVGLHAAGELAVAEPAPGPAAQGQRQASHADAERQTARTHLAPAGVLAHEFAVGEDDLGKQVLQKKPIL
jgi:hypothetical protein